MIKSKKLSSQYFTERTLILRLSRNIWCSYFSLLSPCSVLSESSSSRTRNSEFGSSSEYSQGPACDTGTCLFSPFEVRMGESWIWVKPLDEGAEGARFSDDGLRAEVMVRWRPLSGKLERHKAAILAKGRVGARGNWRKENLLNSRMEFMSLTWSLRMCTGWQKIARGNWNLNYLCS